MNAAVAWRKAVDAGATPIVPEGPIDIDGGPNKGARAAYLRIHNGITLEFYQPAKPGAAALSSGSASSAASMA